MIIAAHRGDSYCYHENTMTAFRSAITKGADMIETDVHLTKDGVPVLIHDRLVDRTTDGTGIISDMTFAECRKLNAGDALIPDKIPTLEELFALVAPTGTLLNIEIKDYLADLGEAGVAKCVDKVLELAEQYHYADRILINSFDAAVLEYTYRTHGKKYRLHGFYAYNIMKNVVQNPEEYLFCACLLTKNRPIKKECYDYLIAHNIEPWIGADVVNDSVLTLAARYGAKLITTNNPGDTAVQFARCGITRNHTFY